MEELDGDEVRVSSRGRLAERDIVQVLLMIIFKFAGLSQPLFGKKKNHRGYMPLKRVGHIYIRHSNTL